jgi:hypothetical protein
LSRRDTSARPGAKTRQHITARSGTSASVLDERMGDHERCASQRELPHLNLTGTAGKAHRVGSTGRDLGVFIPG